MNKIRKSKFSFSKDDLQKVVDELEARGTFPNHARVFLAVERTEWAKQIGLRASNIAFFVKKFDITLKTKKGKRGRPPSKKKNNSTTAVSNNSPDALGAKIKKVSNEKVSKPNRPSGVFNLRKFEIECDLKLSQEYASELKANGRVIFYKAGDPYFNNLSLDNVQKWIKLNVNAALNDGLLLYPTVFYHWVQREFPHYTREYEKVKNLIIQYFVDQGLGKFVI